MVELTMAARQAYKTMLETVRQELAGQPGPQTPPSPPIQDPIQSTEEGTLESTGKEPHYSECSGEETSELSVNQNLSRLGEQHGSDALRLAVVAMGGPDRTHHSHHSGPLLLRF